MSRQIEDRNRRMLRARDLMDRSYAEPLNVSALARVTHTSPAHFSRTFVATFGETPHRYLQRRRVERAARLLRETDQTVTDVCMAVGFTSLGTFSRTFSSITGCSPSSYRRQRQDPLTVPDCAVMAWARVSSSGEVRPPSTR
ncbi:MAG: AraC family transcriptional regulator [Propionibacteriales bacterium]|nr:AraC family transcriptional regulator [Propionibacteriales bacterium]